MHFLFQAIPALAHARPHWEIHVIGSMAVPELLHLAASNVQIQFWDDDPYTRLLYPLGGQVLKWLGKANDSGFLIQKRAELFGLSFGDHTKRKEALNAADVVWVPHYNLSLDRISLFHDLKCTRAPVMFTIHDIHPVIFPNDHSVGDLVRFYQGFLPVAKSCQLVVTHSQAQKAAILQHLGLPDEKVVVTPQPPLIDPVVLLEAYDPARSTQILKNFGINRPYVFYPASTTHIHKNHIRLLTAWAQLKAQLGDRCPQLVCTGKGNRRQYQNLAALMKAFGLQRDVVFTGSIGTPELAALFQNCLMVVIPTLYEGAGSGILTDALVSGKPVACADIPYIREQLDALGSVEITLFDPQNVWKIVAAVRSVLDNLDAQQQVALHNQELANQAFTKMWQIWADDYAKFIERMLSE